MEVVRYIEEATSSQGLSARFTIDGDEVVVTA
jgi:hypothetical protein